MRLLAVVLTALAGSAALPSVAGAATFVSLSGSELVIQGDGRAGELSAIMSTQDSVMVFDESDDPGLTAQGEGCFDTGPTHATCTVPSGTITAVRATLDEGGDAFDASGLWSGVRAFVYGGPGNDALTGGPANDFLDGEEGDDLLRSEGGADVLAGGDGTDELTYSGRELKVVVTLGDGADDGGLGERDYAAGDIERVTGGDGPDELWGDEGSQRLSGGPGTDTLHGGPGPDELDGGADADAVYGDDGDDDLQVAGQGGDVADGGAGVDRIDYASASPVVVTVGDGQKNDGGINDGDDVTATVEQIAGGSFTDRLTGTDGSQRLYGLDGADQISGRGGDDLLQGGEHDDDVSGGTGNDFVFGDGGADRVDGGWGGDVLDGGLNGDTIFGGAGIDRVSYLSRTAGVTVRLGSRADDGEAGEGDYVAGDVENATGGSGNDTFVGTAANNLFDGQGGGDDFFGGGGTDTVSYASRTSGVIADIDGARDDGNSVDGPTPSVRDLISTDIENLTGGKAGDRLSATLPNAVVNVLDGGVSGDDKLKVRDGTSTVDRLLCGAGTDQYDRDASDSITLCETATTLP